MYDTDASMRLEEETRVGIILYVVGVDVVSAHRTVHVLRLFAKSKAGVVGVVRVHVSDRSILRVKREKKCPQRHVMTVSPVPHLQGFY